MQTRFAGQNLSSGNLGAFALGGGGAAAGAVLATQGAQFASQFIMPAITPLGNFVGQAVKVGVGAFLAEDAGIFSSLIANQAGNLVKALPFFQAEATLTSRIASFVAGNARLLGAGLAVVGMAASLYMTYRDGQKAKEREKQRMETMDEIEKNFQTVADNIALQMTNGVKDWMAANIDPIIASFDEKIKSVAAQESHEQVKSEKLAALLKRTENLIGEIQACH